MLIHSTFKIKFLNKEPETDDLARMLERDTVIVICYVRQG